MTSIGCSPRGSLVANQCFLSYHARPALYFAERDTCASASGHIAHTAARRILPGAKQTIATASVPRPRDRFDSYRNGESKFLSFLVTALGRLTLGRLLSLGRLCLGALGRLNAYPRFRGLSTQPFGSPELAHRIRRYQGQPMPFVRPTRCAHRASIRMNAGSLSKQKFTGQDQSKHWFVESQPLVN